ncbi:MAG: hypothetical protein V7668_17955 [Cereibacter changlensis]
MFHSTPLSKQSAEAAAATRSATIDSLGIRIAYAAARSARWRFWLFGVPTADDLVALRRDVARKLGVTPEAVAAAVPAERSVG